eukprot:329016-Hanusia_phi.AAC.2
MAFEHKHNGGAAAERRCDLGLQARETSRNEVYNVSEIVYDDQQRKIRVVSRQDDMEASDEFFLHKSKPIQKIKQLMRLYDCPVVDQMVCSIDNLSPQGVVPVESLGKTSPATECHGRRWENSPCSASWRPVTVAPQSSGADGVEGSGGRGHGQGLLLEYHHGRDGLGSTSRAPPSQPVPPPDFST